MPGIGAPEILMVAVIALIVFGPRRLPEIARSLGKTFAEFKRQASDVRAEFESGLGAEDNAVPEDEKPAPEVDADKQKATAPTSAGDEQPAPAAPPVEDERPA